MDNQNKPLIKIKDWFGDPRPYRAEEILYHGHHESFDMMDNIGTLSDYDYVDCSPMLRGGKKKKRKETGTPHLFELKPKSSIIEKLSLLKNVDPEAGSSSDYRNEVTKVVDVEEERSGGSDGQLTPLKRKKKAKQTLIAVSPDLVVGNYETGASDGDKLDTTDPETEENVDSDSSDSIIIIKYSESDVEEYQEEEH